MTIRVSSPVLSATEQQRAESIAKVVETGVAGIPHLIAQLTEPSWALRRLAVAALAGLGDAAVQPVCDVLRTQRDDEARIAAAVDVLAVSTGKTVDDAALRLATEQDPAIVADAAQILGRRRSAAAIPLLADLLDHADDNVAVGAIEALGRIGGKTVVDALIKATQSRNFFRTFPAIDVLGRSGDPRAVAPLVALLDDPRYAPEATRALGRTGEKAAVAPLARLLTRPSDTTARLAATALAELCDRHLERFGVTTALDAALHAALPTAAAERLTRLLDRVSAAEQIALCRVLGELGDDSAAAALMRLLEAGAPVAAAAGEALKKLGQKTQASLLDALREGDSAQRLARLPLIGAHAGAIPEIAACLADPDPSVRALACDALARIGHPSVVPALFPLLSDRNLRVVHAAVSAIQSLGSAETEALTLAAARSGPTPARRAALRIIGYFGYASALDLLTEVLSGSDDRLRDGAIAALAFLEVPRAVEALLGAARHGAASTRGAAMRALGQCAPGPDVTACLHLGLGDPDPWVRYYACQSLGKLRWDSSAEAIAGLLEDQAGQVRVAAVEALSHLNSEVAFEALRKAAGSEDADMRRAALIGLGIRRAPAAVSILLAATSAADAATRLVAVSAVAGFDDPEALAALGRAAADPDESVRTAALGILAPLPAIEATRALIELLRAGAPDERVLAALSVASAGRIQGILAALEGADDELAPRLTSALARMRRADATAALLQALSLPGAPARRAAAATLGAIGTPAAIEQLQLAAAADPDPEVRRISALALSQ